LSIVVSCYALQRPIWTVHTGFEEAVNGFRDNRLLVTTFGPCTDKWNKHCAYLFTPTVESKTVLYNKYFSLFV